MMPAAFKTIAFGLLLVILNFHINGIDILPDWIGYLLIIRGSYVLREQTGIHTFNWIKICSAGMLIVYLLLSFSDLPARPQIVDLSFGSILQMLNSILSLINLYLICSAIYIYASQNQSLDIANKARQRGYAYLIVNTFTIIVTPILGMFSVADGSFALLLTAIILVNLIIVFLIVILLFQVSKLPMQTAE
ncbi:MULTISPECIES: hypothetical protein [unclassified Paenibacillus]|uniref:hypothetical protein n=1 Tax=unclassified Paenibacillus TaxID=185978 RepID=UPI002F40E30F